MDIESLLGSYNGYCVVGNKEKRNECFQEIVAAFQRKDQLLKEALSELNDKIAFDKQDTDLIERIRKEVQ